MRFEDGGESLASDESCATIVKDVPVMTNADVVQTATDGEVLCLVSADGNGSTTISAALHL